MRRLLLAVPLLAFAFTAAAIGPSQARTCHHLFLEGEAPVLSGPQPGRQSELCFLAFAARVSGEARDPLWSAEHLTAAYAHRGPRSKRSGSFHPEPKLPQEDRAYPRDYGHGWDRGHMTPAGDVASHRAKDQTFSMANVVPQAPALNRGLWESIERAVRQMAEADGSVYIVTGPVLRPGDPHTSNGRVQIPGATWKAVYAPKTGRSVAWICSNTDAPSCRTLSLAALAQDVGVIPFPALSARQRAAGPAAVVLPPSHFWPPKEGRAERPRGATE